jgi:pyruvate/2-oxoacid:ferredoxin oxidoreductase alpha subunit
LHCDADDEKRLISSIELEPERLEAHNRKLQAKYAEIEKAEIRCETYKTDDAELVVIGYGVISRILQSVVDRLRQDGYRIGMLRPITLWPFPRPQIEKLLDHVQKILVVELSNGQMVDDVRLTVKDRIPIHFYNRMGGVVPSPEEIIEQVIKLFEA